MVSFLLFVSVAFVSLAVRSVLRVGGEWCDLSEGSGFLLGMGWGFFFLMFIYNMFHYKAILHVQVFI